MQKASRLHQLKERSVKAKTLHEAPEEVQNIVRLASLLIDIQVRKRKKGKK